MTGASSSETVLVTGGRGFVAGWCIAQLLQRGYLVRTTLRSLTKETAVRSAVATAGVPTENLSFVVADLTKDDGWDAAMQGADYVLHVASPLGSEHPKDPNDLIIPAREGTLRVLRAATKAGVKRVVMTSSAAAATPSTYGDTPSDESVWTDPAGPNLTAYRLSKLLAEQAAWAYMREHGGATTFATILPGAIFGPVLSTDNLGSVQVIQRLLRGQPPRLAHLGLNVVDVRDLAQVHLNAMTAPAAAGERFLVTGEFLWMEQVAQILRTGLGTAAAKVPTRSLPDFVVRGLALFVPDLKAIAPLIGRTLRFSSAKAEQVLGYKPRPVQDTILDCARSITPAAAA